METSDSECFESADEEIYDEDEKSKEDIAFMQDKLQSLKLSEDNSVSTSRTKKNIVSDVEFKKQSTVFDNSEIKVNAHERKCEESVEKETAVVKERNQVTQNRELEEKEYVGENEQNQPKDITETKTTDKISVHEVCSAIEFKKNTENICDLKINEISIKDKPDKEEGKINSDDLQTENSLTENLWEGDGWDIEEEIEEPDVKNEEVLNAKDPLNISTENMWDNEGWEDVEDSQSQQKNTFNQPNNNTNVNKQTNNDSWGSWGNWGVTSLLSTATQGVSSITSQVSQGLSSVLESGIGIPSPEELAKMNVNEEKKAKEIEISENTQQSADNIETDIHGNPIGFVFGNLVSGVSNITKFVENTSTKVISGGLETLETIGKKTMEVLQEGDPGLKKKRAFLKLEQEKPILSQVLREAKEKAEQDILENKYDTKQFVKKVNYETLFDDYHGLVHLEALEMLSKQCDLKLKTLCDNCSGDVLVEIQETMDQIKELCELPDEDEDEQLSLNEIKEKLQLAVQDINVNVTYAKLISSWEETENWLDNIKTNICSPEELHHQAIETLAQLTALAVEQYHKAGELLLIKDHHSTADEADSLVQLTTTLTSLIGIVAAKFSDKLNLMLSSKGDSCKDEINNLITNVFYEASNSSSYIQDAFQLLIPVLQVGAI